MVVIGMQQKGQCEKTKGPSPAFLVIILGIDKRRVTQNLIPFLIGCSPTIRPKVVKMLHGFTADGKLFLGVRPHYVTQCSDILRKPMYTQS